MDKNNVTITDSVQETIKWFENRDLSVISFDTETAPTNVDFTSFKKDCIDTFESKCNRNFIIKLCKRLVEGTSTPWKEVEETVNKSVEGIREAIKSWDVTNIDGCRDLTNLMMSYFSNKTGTGFPQIDSYYEGGSSATLKYYYYDCETLQFYDGKDALIILRSKMSEEDKEILREALIKYMGKIQVIIIHNAKFDLKVLNKIGVPFTMFEKCTVYDTMIADHLINENRRHGLKSLAKELLYKEETMSYTEARGFGLESNEFATYMTNDVVFAWELRELQKPILEDEDLVDLFLNIEMKYLFPNTEMEIEGMVLDKDLCRKLSIKTKELMNELEDKMYSCLSPDKNISFDESGNMVRSRDINFNSPKQLIEIFKELNIEIKETTPSGKPSVGKSTLDEYKDSIEFIGYLSKYKAASKLYNSYLSEDGQLIQNCDGDNRIRGNYSTTGTKTGRSSSSKPNCQQFASDKENLGIEVRECLTVPEGYMMVTCDFSGQENIVLGEITKDEVLCNLLSNGGDLHLANANAAFNLGIPDEALFSSHKDFKMYSEKYSKERKKAKAITFGVAYGIGPQGLSKQMKCSEEEAQEALDAYARKFTTVIDAMNESAELVESQGYVTSMFKRRRRFTPMDRFGNIVYSNADKRQAFNFLIQGASADMTRLAIINIYNKRREYKDYDIRILGAVHDEVIVMCKEQYSEEVASLLKKWMEECVQFSLPVSAESGIGKNYATAK